MSEEGDGFLSRWSRRKRAVVEAAMARARARRQPPGA